MSKRVGTDSTILLFVGGARVRGEMAVLDDHENASQQFDGSAVSVIL